MFEFKIQHKDKTNIAKTGPTKMSRHGAFFTKKGRFNMKNKKIKFLSNHSGGILGGISTGEDIIIRLAIKSVASITKKQKTITNLKQNTTIQTFGRHDSCLAPRIIPVAENMAAIVLVDFLL